ASMSFGAIAVPVASASSGTTVPPKASSLPALDTVKLTGVGKGNKQFNGTYAIQRFVVRNNKAYAIGTLKGTLKGRHVTRYSVMLPASLADPSNSAARAAQTTCPILHLVLGPINLNLLGLQVTTNQIVVDITAIPGAGNLLGNLLCDLTGALNQPGILTSLNQDLQQLTTTLTSLVSLLGGSTAGL
ncbi:MAG TPA: hypothetical protein VGI50_15220, partial [Solirubrobacteraceae bacterium]